MEEVVYHIPPKKDKFGDDIRFKIIVPFFNGMKYLQKCLESIENQTYKNYDVVVIDDASDEFGIKAYALGVFRKNNWKIIFNGTNKGILYNRILGTNFFKLSDDDVIVALDGDDWLKENALEVVNNYYKKYDILMTYGSHEHFPGGEYGLNNGALLKSVVDNGSYRKTRWCYSHLRTFKYILWKNINDSDLRYKDGDYYTMTSDLAFMFPMLEMAGDRIVNVSEIIYVYNMENPLNDHKKSAGFQAEYDMFIRSKPQYSRL